MNTQAPSTWCDEVISSAVDEWHLAGIRLKALFGFIQVSVCIVDGGA